MMPSASTCHPLLSALRARFVARGDPERAVKQQAYMKSAMPYHGIDNTTCRRICKQVFAPYTFDLDATWRADVRALWAGATHREERYAALHLAADARARPLQGLPRTARATPPPDPAPLVRSALALYEAMIVEGAWWDLVDELACHHLGPLVRAHHAILAPEMRQWARGDDLWKRRAAIICQVGSRADTDVALLEDVIACALDDRTFWLRKAIGWALREYAKSDPEWVRVHVAALGARLSGLSRREALKHCGS